MTHQEMEIKIKELEKRIKALEQEQIDFIRPKKSIPITLTVEGDCISRQAASKAINRISLCKCNINEIEAADECLRAVEDLPPVTLQPKIGIGRWIDDKCSVCGKGIEDLISSPEWYYRGVYPHFCPFCGIEFINSQGCEEG